MTTSSKLRACIVGFGSIGKRHTEILAESGIEVAIISRRASPQGGLWSFFSSLEECLNQFRPDYIVIANETSEHYQTLQSVLKHHDFKGKVLIEKPVFRHEIAISTPAEMKIGVGYNLRFHPAAEALKQHLQGQTIVTAHFIVGQWLPDWRPDQPYQKSYSADPAQGGGVLRDLSHELDLAQWLCGTWESVAANIGKRSDLEIKSEDSVDLLLKCQDCKQVNIHLNYLFRQPQRRISINTLTQSLIADLIANTLTINTDKPQQFVTERNDSYKKMHANFLSDSSHVTSLEEGLALMELIAAAESSNKNQEWTSR